MPFDLILENVAIRYQDHTLCDNIHLRLKAGTCTCLLGASGVGKSSLLHLIASISDKSVGLPIWTTRSVACEGQESRVTIFPAQLTGRIHTSDNQSLDERVMLMTQQDNLLPWLNILDNVLIGYTLRNKITDALQHEAETLLQQVGLASSDWQKKPKALSGGMRQRVALARTVMEDKPLWLLDEPFSALDAITRYKMQNLLAGLWKGKTVLLVTHDPLEALRLADEIYVMRGSPAQLEKVNIFSGTLTKPRELTPELLAQQAVILKMLVGGHSERYVQDDTALNYW